MLVLFRWRCNLQPRQETYYVLNENSPLSKSIEDYSEDVFVNFQSSENIEIEAIIGAARNFIILISGGEHEYISRHPSRNFLYFPYIFQFLGGNVSYDYVWPLAMYVTYATLL